MLALVFAVCGGPLRADSFEDGLTAFRAGEPGRAHDIWLPLAGEGDAAAQYSLGKLFEHGEGPIPQDLAKAVYWYRSAADQGLPAAQNNLALMYAQGRGVPGDLNSAIELWRAAAEQNYPWAQYNLGLAYFRGQGVAVDQREAAQWFHRAADGGLAEAQFIMGQLRREGLGLEKDEGRALAWYHRAADQGHLRARKQANALRAAGVVPKPTTETETATVPVQELAASLPKPSDSGVVNGGAVRKKPRDSAQAATGQSSKAEKKAPAQSAKGAKTSNTGSDPKQDRKTETAAKKQVADRQDPPKRQDQPKAKAQPKAEAKASGKPEKAKTPSATKAAVPPTTGRKAKAPPKGRPKPKRLTGHETAEAQGTPDDQGRSQTEKKEAKPAGQPAPDAGRQTAEGPGQSEGETGEPSKAAAAQSAALPVDGRGPAEPKANGGFRVWLASAGSQAQAKELWRQVQGRHPDILAGADVGYSKVDLGGQTLFRVLVGPLASESEAEQLCVRLRTAEPKAFCKVRAE